MDSFDTQPNGRTRNAHCVEQRHPSDVLGNRFTQPQAQRPHHTLLSNDYISNLHHGAAGSGFDTAALTGSGAAGGYTSLAGFGGAVSGWGGAPISATAIAAPPRGKWSDTGRRGRRQGRGRYRYARKHTHSAQRGSSRDRARSAERHVSDGEYDIPDNASVPGEYGDTPWIDGHHQKTQDGLLRHHHKQDEKFERKADRKLHNMERKQMGIRQAFATKQEAEFEEKFTDFKVKERQRLNERTANFEQGLRKKASENLEHITHKQEEKLHNLQLRLDEERARLREKHASELQHWEEKHHSNSRPHMKSTESGRRLDMSVAPDSASGLVGSTFGKLASGLGGISSWFKR